MVLGTTAGDDSARRFLQEARAAAALDHPNVVPIYDTGEIDGRPYFTMALVDGPNLRGYAEARGVIPIPEVVSLFAQTVDGVAHAHRHGIIHRDLKPANVLVDRDGRPRVTDFGLAKRAAADTHLTATGQVVGTPSYMAPEQARDSKDVGPPADVYGLGAILYFLLAGRPPFHSDSLTDLLIKVVSDAPVPPSRVRADVPDDLEAVCLRCLAKQPAARYADAAELAAALAPIRDQYRTGSGSRSALTRPAPPSLPPAGSVPELSALVAAGPLVRRTGSVPAVAPAPQPPAPAHNRLPVVAGLAALALVLVGLGGYLLTRQKPTATTSAEVPAAPPDAPPRTDKDADPFAWPVPARADFGLKVELVAPAAKSGPDGTIRLSAGVPMTYHLTAERDCRVSIWVLEPTGHATRLFPNDDDTDDRLTAGKERVLPSNDRYTFEATPTDGAGVDRLRVLATTGEPPAFPPGVKDGRYTSYAADADRERLANTVRGVTIKKAGAAEPGAVAETELKFVVRK
jgi:hypothetical protein